MISLARIHLVLFSICTVALGTEPNDTGVQLTFQISPIPLAAPHPLQAKPQDRKPSYAAGITAQGPTDFFPGPRSNRVDDFLSFAHQQGLSLPQKEFLEDTNGLLDSTERSVTFYYPMDDPNRPQVLLYAMSLADAKRMAELYLQFAWKDYKGSRDRIEWAIRDVSEQAAKAEKRIPELEKSLEAMQKSFEQAKSVVPYRSEQEALEAIGELGRMLNTA